jgi:hypothetical protein
MVILQQSTSRAEPHPFPRMHVLVISCFFSGNTYALLFFSQQRTTLTERVTTITINLKARNSVLEKRSGTLCGVHRVVATDMRRPHRIKYRSIKIDVSWPRQNERAWIESLQKGRCHAASSRSRSPDASQKCVDRIYDAIIPTSCCYRSRSAKQIQATHTVLIATIGPGVINLALMKYGVHRWSTIAMKLWKRIWRRLHQLSCMYINK